MTVDDGKDGGRRPDRRRSEARHELQRALDAHRNSAMLCAAAKLGLPDLLAHGPLSAAELAVRAAADASSLERLLRGLVALGVCREAPSGLFGLTMAGELLRSDAADTLHDYALLVGDEYRAAWGDLLHSVRTGEPAFDHVFGMSPWDHRAKHPTLGKAFQSWLARATAAAAASLADACDLSSMGAIMDVGGGEGTLLAALLRRWPALRGSVFDRPAVAALAAANLRTWGLADRGRAIAGDFFEEIPPAPGAILLKSVLHDWPDDRSARLLSNCRRALLAGDLRASNDGARPRAARLLVVERLLPEAADAELTHRMLDLHMLVVTGGRERTSAEYRALLDACGFDVTGIAPAASGFSILDCVPRR